MRSWPAGLSRESRLPGVFRGEDGAGPAGE